MWIPERARVRAVTAVLAASVTTVAVAAGSVIAASVAAGAASAADPDPLSGPALTSAFGGALVGGLVALALWTGALVVVAQRRVDRGRRVAAVGWTVGLSTLVAITIHPITFLYLWVALPWWTGAAAGLLAAVVFAVYGGRTEDTAEQPPATASDRAVSGP